MSLLLLSFGESDKLDQYQNDCCRLLVSNCAQSGQPWFSRSKRFFSRLQTVLCWGAQTWHEDGFSVVRNLWDLSLQQKSGWNHRCWWFKWAQPWKLFGGFAALCVPTCLLAGEAGSTAAGARQHLFYGFQDCTTVRQFRTPFIFGNYMQRLPELEITRHCKSQIDEIDTNKSETPCLLINYIPILLKPTFDKSSLPRCPLKTQRKKRRWIVSRPPRSARRRWVGERRM